MWLSRMSSYIARYKGMPTMIAIVLVAINFVLGLFPGLGWIATSDIFLHLGIIVGFIGLLLAAALG